MYRLNGATTRTGLPQSGKPRVTGGGYIDPATITRALMPGLGLGLGYDAKTQQSYPVQGAVTSGVGRAGRGAALPYNTDCGIEIIPAFSVDTYVSATVCSILVLRTLNSTGAFSANAQHGYSAGPSDRILAHAPFSDGTIYWDFGNATSGSGRTSAAGVSWQAGKTDALAFVAGPTKGREIWLDGVRLASDPGATASRPGTPAPFRAGGSYTGAPNDETLYQFLLIDAELTDAQIRRWSAAPWSILTDDTRTLWVPPGVSVQLLVPISDVSLGAWLPSSGSTLWPMLDETPADDADFISVGSSGQTAEVAVTVAGDPASSTGQYVDYNACADGGLGLTVRLVEGTTIIASQTPSLTPTIATFRLTLSGPEADAISDFSNLRLRFIST